MKFEERVSKAHGLLSTFLEGFSAPRGLGSDAKISVKENIAIAFARRLPITDERQFEENVEKTFTAVRDRHTGWAWPNQSEFVDGMPKAGTGKAQETYKPKARLEVVSRQMLAHQSISENVLWSARDVQDLVFKHQVPQEFIDGYRGASVKNFQEIYRDKAWHVMAEKYGNVVNPYFERLAA